MTQKEINKAAKELFEVRTEDVLYSNPKGEFFTNKNFAELSLKKGEKIVTHNRPEKKGNDAADESPKKGGSSSKKGDDTAAKVDEPVKETAEEKGGDSEKASEDTTAKVDEPNPKK